jgi:hypothetical protein
MPWIALAVLGASVYTANQQSASAAKAREQASRQATQASQAAERQIAAQREAAQVARERLNFEVGQSAEERARLEQQSQRMAQDLETQQREMAEAESTRMRQMRRGGFRSLLSQERLTPEAGLGSYDSGMLGMGTSL